MSDEYVAVFWQVYFIKEKLREKIERVFKRLVPEAKICIAHGRMEKNELNNVIKGLDDGVYGQLNDEQKNENY